MNTRSLTRDVILGALGFGCVSIAAFSLWAFGGRWFRGEAVLYSAIAVVFAGGAGLVLAPLAGGIGRAYRVFIPAFLSYAVIWCAAWFGLGGKTGEWLGAIVGGTVFTLISLRLLGSLRGWAGALAAFLVLHCVGYFAGDWAYAYAKAGGQELAASFGLTAAGARTAGRLAWGVLYGLGFGAGIGWVYHRGRASA